MSAAPADGYCGSPRVTGARGRVGGKGSCRGSSGRIESYVQVTAKLLSGQCNVLVLAGQAVCDAPVGSVLGETAALWSKSDGTCCVYGCGPGHG